MATILGYETVTWPQQIVNSPGLGDVLMPYPPAKEAVWTARNVGNGQVSSLFDGSTQRFIWGTGAGLWEVKATFPIMNQRDPRALAFLAFILQCQGTRNAFLWGDFATLPGAATGPPSNPIVVGGGQTGTTLATGLLPSDLIVPGDWFSMNNRIYRITSAPDGAGNISFWPPIPPNESPGDGDGINMGPGAIGLFKLKGNSPSFNQGIVVYEEITLEMEEAR